LNDPYCDPRGTAQSITEDRSSLMPTDTLTPADFDLDLEVAEIVESEMSAQKTGVTDICTTIYWPCRK
jgi:hypothetical protein